MTGPEAPLWAMLDQVGLPFRESLGELVRRYGATTLLWSSSLQGCTPPSRALVPGLSEFTAQIRPGEDVTLPPSYLSAWLRTHTRPRLADLVFDRRAQRNFAEVLAGIVPRLGKGQDVSTSNTLGREWRFGMACLRATAFPLHLNRGHAVNRRHVAEPGSQTECGLALDPGWLPPLTAEQEGWVADFERFGTPVAPFFSAGYAPPRWHRLEGNPPAPGYGPSRDGRGFVVVSGEYARVVARADLIGLSRDLLEPGRGGGKADLVLRHAPAGVAGVTPHRLLLDGAAFSADALARQAQALSMALDLPLVESRDIDM